ncbi:MAG: hypothetical protein QNK33_05535 [Bacteroidales bacterium]|nr:hypothetical protein [Bacteroidales bacterium]
MAKKVIIGIHGLGNKAPKDILEKWWKESMLEGLARQELSTALPEFKMVYWADLIYNKPYNLQEEDEESESYLEEKYTPADPDFKAIKHPTRKIIVDFLDHHLNKILLNEDLSLNYSVITDAIISRYFKELDTYYSENCTLGNADTCNTKDLINQRLIDVINEYKGYEIMIIGHSMGSIIAYEVLQFCTFKNTIDYFITMGSPLGLPVVISKIAAEQKDNSIMGNKVITPQSVVKYWYNFSDILDKVAFDYQLVDDFTKNEFGVSPTDFLIVNDYVYKGKPNPHKSFGYLRAPEFSVVLNNFISESLTAKQRILIVASKIMHRLGEALTGKKKK